MTPTLILASSSPRRRELLASLGLDFTITKPDVDESERIPEKPTR
jgi:septum formation protein